MGVTQSAAELRWRASECYQRAQDAVVPRRKKLWLIMAQLWLDRAESAERDDRQIKVSSDPSSPGTGGR